MLHRLCLSSIGTLRIPLFCFFLGSPHSFADAPCVGALSVPAATHGLVGPLSALLDYKLTTLSDGDFLEPCLLLSTVSCDLQPNSHAAEGLR